MIDPLRGPQPDGTKWIIGAPDNPLNKPMTHYAPTGEKHNLVAQADGSLTPNRWVATVNTTKFGAREILVPKGTPRVPVYVVNADGSPNTDSWNGAMREVLAAGVPIPANTQPAPADDTDAQFEFYDPYDARGRIWCFWQLRKDARGRWTCRVGGRLSIIELSPGTSVDRFATTWGRNLPTVPEGWGKALYEEAGWGISASNIPTLFTGLTHEDVRLGKVEHCLAIACLPNSLRPSHRPPATSHDGWGLTPGAPMEEGMRLVFPPGVTVPTGLHPIARCVADACVYRKRPGVTEPATHGLIVTDKSDALAVIAEPDVSQQFGGFPAYKLLAGFPWDKLVVVR